MNFSKAFGCGKISPSREDGTAEENFMKGLEAVQKHGDNVEWKDVVKYYLRAANEGLPEACCNLGVCYATGRGVQQSAEEAVHWYQLAAEKGLPRAQSNLAGCYASGRGVQQDWMLAAMWFQKAAEAGDGTAACSLGAMHAEGKGVMHDGASAAYWFHKGAKQGQHSAMFNLALCYEQGTGCDPDHLKAVYWYLRAARGNKSLANLASERVSQLRKEFNVDVNQVENEMSIDDSEDFTLDPSLLSLRRTGTDESRASTGKMQAVKTKRSQYCCDVEMASSPQDCAISMERDGLIGIDKHGKLKRKMSGIPEDGSGGGSGSGSGSGSGGGRFKDFFLKGKGVVVNNSSRTFLSMLGLRRSSRSNSE